MVPVSPTSDLGPAFCLARPRISIILNAIALILASQHPPAKRTRLRSAHNYVRAHAARMRICVWEVIRAKIRRCDEPVLFVWRRRDSSGGGAFVPVERRVSSRGGKFLRVERRLSTGTNAPPPDEPRLLQTNKTGSSHRRILARITSHTYECPDSTDEALFY